MSISPIAVVCSHCQNKFTETPKRSFLGFQKLTCLKCNTKLTFPLTDGYRIIYWILLVFMILSVIGSLSQGNFALPGLVSFAMIFALIRDKQLKKKLILEKSYE